MLIHCYSLEILRTVQVFKQFVRLKSSNEMLIGKVKNIGGETNTLRSEALSETLNCNIHTAHEIIAKNSDIIKFNRNSFYQNAKFCKEYFKLSDLIEFPCLLTLQPNLLQHRYFSLKELGFSIVSPSYILRFPNILKESPESLKQRGFPFICNYKCDILNDYLHASERTEIKNKLQCMYKDGSNLQKIKEIMNAEFLSAKLECSIGRAHQMIHKYAPLKAQSIFITEQLLNVLLYKIGLSVSKIHSSLNLLSMHHEAVEHFLSEIPEVLDVDILFLIKKLPPLLKKEKCSLNKAEAVLKAFNINKDQLTCCPKVLTIAPNTLHRRLSDLCSREDFVAMKSNKKFLWLVYCYCNVNERLEKLKLENIPYSINMFTASKSAFESYIFSNNNSRTCLRETCMYLVEVFKIHEKEISDRLHHCSYIQNEYKNVSTLNCRRVIEFLLLSGVTKEQIFNGLEIVFYDIATVKIHFNRLKTHYLCQPYEEWVSHYNLIHLLIYTIEVNTYHPASIGTCEEEELFLEYSN